MNRWTTMSAVLALGIGLGAMMTNTSEAAPGKDKMIGHMVFFKLKEPTEANKSKLVDACYKYLTKHDGEAFFAAGEIGKEFNRPVNDMEWDVALHMVFKTKADHDKYQDHPRHQSFINENKDGWAKVRVFDSLIAPR